MWTLKWMSEWVLCLSMVQLNAFCCLAGIHLLIVYRLWIFQINGIIKLMTFKNYLLTWKGYREGDEKRNLTFACSFFSSQAESICSRESRSSVRSPTWVTEAKHVGRLLLLSRLLAGMWIGRGAARAWPWTCGMHLLQILALLTNPQCWTQ